MHSQQELKIIIVIPVYNHSTTLPGIVNGALAVHDYVMVVDDGSTDNSADTLAGLNVHLIHHEKNLGKGAAIKTADIAARKLGMTHIVTIDANGRYDPADFHLFAGALKKNMDSIIIGKRDFQKGEVPILYKFSRRLANFWFQVQTGVNLGDVRCTFRAYPLAVLENLTLRTRRNSFEVEVLTKAAWAGVNLNEVNISVYFHRPEKHKFNFDSLMDKLRVTLFNFHLTMRSIVPWPHQKLISKDRSGKNISVLHPLRSIKTLLTENTSPRQLAAACALGVFLGTLPIIGFHNITILFAASYFRLNKVVALTTSGLCVPPFVPALCIEAGYFMRHGTFLTEISIKTLGYQALERIYEWLIGSLVLAPVFAVLVGGIIFLVALFLKRTRGNSL
jgi:glycosyltransferase involved in cell wall biosynthesis